MRLGLAALLLPCMAREGFWARQLAAVGVATLIVESFSARGVGTSLANQSSISTAQSVRDAYAALGYLAAQAYVDPARIGIMGMSRGGSVALRAVDHRGAQFIAHAQNLRDCLLYIEDDGSTTYAKTGERLDSPRIAQEVMQRDCIRTGATIGADARVKAQALEDVKAFLRQTLLR